MDEKCLEINTEIWTSAIPQQLSKLYLLMRIMWLKTLDQLLNKPWGFPQAPSLPFSIHPLDALGLSLLFPSTWLPHSSKHLFSLSSSVLQIFKQPFSIHFLPVSCHWLSSFWSLWSVIPDLLGLWFCAYLFGFIFLIGLPVHSRFRHLPALWFCISWNVT